MGRPKIEIDIKDFEKLCQLQCTMNEIAGFFNCSHDTIERFCKRTYKKTFKEVFEDKRTIGLISLRRYQFKQAEHNTTMAIWLGKQLLGQKEVVINQVANTIEDDDFTKSIKESLGDGI